MIRIEGSDILFVASVGAGLAGCWLLGMPYFLIGVAIAGTITSIVWERVRRIRAQRRGRR